jgi:hypothetical protein
MSDSEKLPRARTYPEDRRAWGILALILLSSYAVFRLSALIHQPWRPSQTDENPRLFHLAVLAFDDVRKEIGDGAITDRKVAEHIQGLLDAGFKPVTLTQIENAYYHEGFLPRRSLLLTFDLGLLETVQSVSPILEEMQIPSVMFVDTGKIEVADRRTVYWDRLRKMVRSGYWEIGSHGHTPFEPGPRNLFDLVNIQEKSEPGPDSFLRSRDYIEKNVESAHVRSFAPRTGIHFTFAQKQKETGAFSYRLGFWDDLFGVNDKLTSPHWLLRLRVNPEWTTGELVQRLEWAAGMRNQEKGKGSFEIHRWLLRDGRARFREDRVILSGEPRSDVWFAGSQWPMDWLLEARVSIDSDEFWITQENRVEPGLSWRFGGDREQLYVQKRVLGQPPEILAKFPMPQQPGVAHDIRLIKRGGGLWIEWDGKPLQSSPIELPGRHQGKVGFVCFQSDGGGRLEVSRPWLVEIPYEVEMIPANLTTEDMGQLLLRLDRLAALSPLCLAQDGSDLSERAFNERRLKMISSVYGWDILAGFKPLDTRLLDRPNLLDELIERAGAEEWDGYCLNLEELDAEFQAAWRSAADQWRPRFYREGLRLEIYPELSEDAEGRTE